MAKKKYQTKHEFTSKVFYGKYTNRVTFTSRYVAATKLKKELKASGLDYKLMDGFCSKIVYFLNADHDKIMDVITNKVKPKRIDSINRPFNLQAQTEMVGDKHLVIVKNLPFKKFRYKIVIKDREENPTNFDFVKAQSEIGTIKASYSLLCHFTETNSWRRWWYSEDYFYVEDEATTSMASLLYSDIIKKIYIYKTFDEMKESQ